MGKLPWIRSQCLRIIGRRVQPRVLGKQSGAGAARSRVWSARTNPGENHRSGVLRCSLASTSRQRATTSPTEDEARGPAQASADAGPPSGHDQDQTTGSHHITSRPRPCRPHLPSTCVQHSKRPVRPEPRTNAAHLQHHGRGSGHGTRPKALHGSWESSPY